MALKKHLFQPLTIIKILQIFFKGSFNKQPYLFTQVGFWHPFENLVLANWINSILTEQN